MTRETIRSRSGATTLRLDGVFLHSRYDPYREAHRYLETLTLTPKKTRVVVVIAEGLPHLSAAIATRFPHITVLTGLLGPETHDYPGRQVDLTSLASGGLRSWLRTQLSTLDVAALELITWEAGRRAAPQIVAEAEQEILEAVRIASAEIATIGSFGRRWLTNAVRSATLIDVRRDLPEPGAAVTLATSGPSLERLVMAGRSAFPGLLGVTSSAWTTVERYGIHPDVVVHTDGGFWATRYLNPDPSVHRGSRPTMAITAHAAVPHSLLRSSDSQSFCFLSTGALADQLHADHEAWQQVPEAPTVTATALHMLHRLAPHSHMYLAGVDLVSRGLISHARPHPNDQFIARRAYRLRPELSIRAERTLGSKPTAHLLADHVVGYRSAALHAFHPEITRVLELHHTSGAVASLLPTPPDDRGGARRAPNPGPAGARSEAPRVGRLTQRPPRGERVAHIRRVVGQWREQAVEGRWDTAQRDVLFHLAPVEVLQALRGERDQKAVIAAAHTGLDVIQQVVERISPA